MIRRYPLLSCFKSFLFTTCLTTTLTVVNSACATDIVEQEEQARFDISAIEVEGNSLVATEKLQLALKPFIIKGATIETLQAALLAIEKIYADEGFSAIKAVLPEQEADAGAFKVSVIEAKLGQVKVIGNEYFSQKNILNSAPDLVIGQTPNLIDVAKSLRIANEGFAKYTRVVITKSEEVGKVDAELKVQDAKPWRFATSLDNTGNDPTGRERLSLVYQHANLFDRDHALAAQFTTSPGHEGQVKIFGISYRIPLYSLADTIDISLGHSNVNFGNLTTTAGSFGISGSGDYISFNFNHALPVWREIEQRLTLGLNWRAFKSEVKQEGGPDLVPDLTSAPASMTYSISQLQNERRWMASLGVVHNLPSGSEGNTEAYNQPNARLGAKSNFTLLRYQAAYSSPINSKFNIAFDMNGQFTDDLLISGEQFGIGGAGSVRGFDPREVNGDQGYKVGIEVSTTPISVFENKNGRLSGLVFFDHGYAKRNKPLPGEMTQETIESAGLGLRLGIGHSFQAKADFARVLSGSATHQDGHYFGHFELVYIF